MHHTRFSRKWGVVSFLLILLEGCAWNIQEKSVDRSILTDSPCAAPCWQGITPGETTTEAAFDILTELGYEPHLGKDGNYVSWHSPAGYPADGYARGANELLSSKVSGRIQYIRVGLEFRLSLETVLGKFGPPGKYLVHETEGTLTEGGHAAVTRVLLIYAGQGLIFEGWMPTFSIDPEMTLDWVYYFPPTSIDHFRHDIPELEQRIPWKELLQDWQE
jgi:hypothetical protein